MGGNQPVSPEAPVPILETRSETLALGGLQMLLTT
ncbi:MAG: hypothetical protein CM1200mP16_16750 [Nitrospina sp.]|nr:MAG: hypothetical protein CM1200mP16_16750 [Nitrospina sp.]